MSSPQKKKDKQNKEGLEGYLHSKPERWTTQNIMMFALPSLLLALVPSFLYFFVYDYRPAGLIGIQYIVYIITIGCTMVGLLSAYTEIFVDNVHYLKTASQTKVGERQQKIMETQSKWWTIFYVNTLFIILFYFANFYVFKSSIPSIHFRYALSTIAPAAAVHFWVNGVNQPEPVTK